MCILLCHQYVRNTWEFKVAISLGKQSMSLLPLNYQTNLHETAETLLCFQWFFQRGNLLINIQCTFPGLFPGYPNQNPVSQLSNNSGIRLTLLGFTVIKRKETRDISINKPSMNHLKRQCIFSKLSAKHPGIVCCKGRRKMTHFLWACLLTSQSKNLANCVFFGTFTEKHQVQKFWP